MLALESHHFPGLQPHVDFGLKIVGCDLMSIPGLYKFVQVQYSSFLQNESDSMEIHMYRPYRAHLLSLQKLKFVIMEKS